MEWGNGPRFISTKVHLEIAWFGTMQSRGVLIKWGPFPTPKSGGLDPREITPMLLTNRCTGWAKKVGVFFV